jgi:hypothetical protein
MEIKIAREQFTFCHFESDAHTKKGTFRKTERQEERKRIWCVCNGGSMSSVS